MKKFLSILLTVAMLVGAIVPALTVSAASGEVVAITVPSQELVTYGSPSFSSKLSLADNTGDLCWLTLIVWWAADAGVDELAVTPINDGLDADNTSVGPVRTGTHRDVKSILTTFGAGTTAYKGCLVDIAAAVDKEGAYIGINDVCDLATLDFTLAEGIAADSSFSYNVAIVTATDSSDEELSYNDSAVAVKTTFIADAQFTALAEEYKGQDLTIIGENATYDKDNGDGVAYMKVFLLNNDVDDSNAEVVGFSEVLNKDTYANIGVWGVATVLVYDKNVFSTEDCVAENGYVFWDETAINTTANLDYDKYVSIPNDTVKFAFQSFEFDPADEANAKYNWAIVAFLPDSPDDQFYGDGLLYTMPFKVAENAKPGAYTINIWSDLADGVSNATNVSVPFQTVDGTITITGEAPACTHDETKDVIITPATCTEDGLKNIVCANEDCGKLIEENVKIDKLGHDLEKTADEIPATCTDDGKTAVYTCKREGCTYTEGGATITKLGHSKDAEWQVITPATTAAAGQEGLYCPVCKEYIDYREIPQLTLAVIEAASSKVLEGAEVSVPVTIENNEGFWAIGATVESELTFVEVEDGLVTLGDDNISYNADTGVITIFFDNAEIADIAEDGVLFTVKYYAPREAGNYDVNVEIFDLINAQGEDVEFAANDAVVTVTACEHNYLPVVVTPATADSEGTLAYICEACGAVEKTEVIPMLTSLIVGEAEGAKNDIVSVPVTLANNNGVWSIGMTIGYDEEALEFVGLEDGLFATDESSASADEGVVTVFVMADGLDDVTEDGVAFYADFKVITDVEDDYDLTAAMIDDYTIDADAENVEIVPFQGKVTVTASEECKHENTTTINAVTATCVTEGYTGDTFCLDCETTIEYGESAGFDAENHEGEVALDPATAVVATCKQGGYEGDYVWSCCGVKDHDGEFLGLLDPNNHEGEVVLDPATAIVATCITEGYEGDYVWSCCGAKDHDGEFLGLLDPNNHEGEVVLDPATAIVATCITEGYEGDYVWSCCGAKDHDGENLGLNAENHEGTFSWVEVTPATTETAGLEEYQCSACHEAIDSREIPVIVDDYTFLIKASATEKVKNVSLNGDTITIYAKALADYVKIAVGKDTASKVKIVGYTDCTVGQAANYSFSYITVNLGVENATITCRNAAGEEEVYNIVIVWSDEGVEAGGNMNAIEVSGTDITVTAPADAEYASFRFVFDVVGNKFIYIPEDVDTVETAGPITWFKIYNDGSNSVEKTITVQDKKGGVVDYTITANFAD